MKQATAPPVNAPLYPELPAGPAETQSVNKTPPDQYFRLQEISRLRNHLEDEKDKRSQLYKKYRRGINAVDAADTALISASMGMGIGGVGLLTTVIAAPVVLGLEIAALGCGLLGVTGKFIGRRLSVKAKNGEQTEHHRRPCLEGTHRWSDLWWRIPPYHRWGLKIYPDEGRDPHWSTESSCCSHSRWGDKKLPHSEGPGRSQSKFHKKAGCAMSCSLSCVCMAGGVDPPAPVARAGGGGGGDDPPPWSP